MEGFFDRANAILRGADRARGIEERRLAIRQLVNEMIEFREAAALALGAAWFSKPRETQAEFIELFTGVLETRLRRGHRDQGERGGRREDPVRG
jgi:MlaC protein